MNHHDKLIQALGEAEQREMEGAEEMEGLLDRIRKRRGKSILMMSTPKGEESWFEKMWRKRIL